MHEKEENLPITERLPLNPAEATLAVQAIGAYAISSQQIHPHNWGVEAAYSILDGSGQRDAQKIRDIISLLKNYQTFIEKITDSTLQPAGVELYAEELSFLGRALFSLGTSDAKAAKLAISEGRIRFDSLEDKQTALQEIDETTAKARTLFEKVEALLRKNGLPWMEWE